MEKGKHRVKIFEVTIHKVEHEARFWELKPHLLGLEHGNKLLNARVSWRFERMRTKTRIT